MNVNVAAHPELARLLRGMALIKAAVIVTFHLGELTLLVAAWRDHAS